jgi:hypothetical protein
VISDLKRQPMLRVPPLERVPRKPRAIRRTGVLSLDDGEEGADMSADECRLARIDPLQLAWAAGFFDGEGTTMAAVRTDRPGYLRLEMTVPQCGHERAPEVLFRLQAALLGMGSITGPNDDDMYFWRAGAFAEAQAAVALLWSELGPVKRRQAATAMRAVQRQYDLDLFVTRGPRRRGRVHDEHLTTRRTRGTREELDLAWAAGFLDGEGHFGLPRVGPRKNAPDWHRIRVSATQNGLPGLPPDVLFRLVRIFGGKIERHGEPDDFRWLMEGVRKVEAVLRQTRPWLGTVKQEQAAHVIQGFRSQIRLHGDASRCARGHEYSSVYLSPTGPKRRCNACARITSRIKRARAGAKPRQFKNVARRYTF